MTHKNMTVCVECFTPVFNDMYDTPATVGQRRMRTVNRLEIITHLYVIPI